MKLVHLSIIEQAFIVQLVFSIEDAGTEGTNVK